jgi:hypothetical protein
MWHYKASQNAWAWRHTVVMGWLYDGWKKNYSHTERRNTGEVCGQVLYADGHFINQQLWSLVVIKLIEGHRNVCYTLGYELSSAAENSQVVPHIFFRRLSVWNNSGVVKLSYQTNHRRFSTWSISYETRSLRQILLAWHSRNFLMRGC